MYVFYSDDSDTSIAPLLPSPVEKSSFVSLIYTRARIYKGTQGASSKLEQN